MELAHVTFLSGSPIDDLRDSPCPAAPAIQLQQLNGFIQFHGGSHVRGACRQLPVPPLRDARSECSVFHSPTAVHRGHSLAEDVWATVHPARWASASTISRDGELQALNLTSPGSSTQFRPIRLNSCLSSPFLQFQRDGGALEAGSCSPTHRSAPSNWPTAFAIWRLSSRTSVGGSQDFAADSRCAGRWKIVFKLSE